MCFRRVPLWEKWYKLLDLKSKKMIISRDVRFYESIYPFSGSFSHSQNLSTPFIFNQESPADTQVEIPQASDVIDSELDNLVPDLNNPVADESSSTSFESTLSHVSPFRETNDQIPKINLKRSDRHHNKPGYLKDYICNYVYLMN